MVYYYKAPIRSSTVHFTTCNTEHIYSFHISHANHVVIISAQMHLPSLIVTFAQEGGRDFILLECRATDSNLQPRVR